MKLAVGEMADARRRPVCCAGTKEEWRRRWCPRRSAKPGKTGIETPRSKPSFARTESRLVHAFAAWPRFDADAVVTVAQLGTRRRRLRAELIGMPRTRFPGDAFERLETRSSPTQQLHVTHRTTVKTINNTACSMDKTLSFHHRLVAVDVLCTPALVATAPLTPLLMMLLAVSGGTWTGSNWKRPRAMDGLAT